MIICKWKNSASVCPAEHNMCYEKYLPDWLELQGRVQVLWQEQKLIDGFFILNLVYPITGSPVTFSQFLLSG
ncbi:hypothetical protein CA264_10030 [Pontibacter actiniarum]|uniref:Uncharacterized protein n=1 Tax=Pontibacter actiniarum TaxID=323450 RepID=A0A1X9YSE1_9BACT|nr:hypothetical protein CA264_10030 [Pontibacter actiniarum]